MASKKTRGRQQIDVTRRRENEKHRLVTFSKRKANLFKAASELSTMCGAELAILIFSSSGRPYSFANPNIETIARRYLNLDQNAYGMNLANPNIETIFSPSRLVEHHAKLTQLRAEADVEIERKNQLAEMANSREEKLMCEKDIGELSDDEARYFKVWLTELMAKIELRIKEMSNANIHLGGFIDPNAPSSSNGNGGVQF